MPTFDFKTIKRSKISVLFSKTFVLIASLFIVQACFRTDDFEQQKNFLKIENEEYLLNYGVIEDFGTNYDISGRYYDITLQSSGYYTASNFIKFRILSTSTSRLQEGKYEFGGSDPGNFWDVEIGNKLQYDSKGVAISGKRWYLNESQNKGFITISKLNDNYLFEYSFTANADTSNTIISGRFTDVLHEDYYVY